MHATHIVARPVLVRSCPLVSSRLPRPASCPLPPCVLSCTLRPTPCALRPAALSLSSSQGSVATPLEPLEQGLVRGDPLADAVDAAARAADDRDDGRRQSVQLWRDERHLLFVCVCPAAQPSFSAPAHQATADTRAVRT